MSPGGIIKNYSVSKVFLINCKNELCGRFHTLKEFSSGGTKFCVNKICMISVYQIGVKVTRYYGLILHWNTKSKMKTLFLILPNLLKLSETFWNLVKLSETFFRNFLSKLQAISKSWKLPIPNCSHKYQFVGHF